MKQSVFLFVLACGLCAGAAQDVYAQTQPWADRGYINIGFGIESGSASISETANIVVYEEPGTVTTTTNWSSGSLFDVAAGVRVYRNFTVGLGYHQEGNDTDSLITGQIPSPIFFNRPRQLNQAVELERDERAVHLMLGWAVPINDKFDVMVYGGPSFFRLEQDVVDDVEIGERGAPFTEVVVQPEILTRKKSSTGFNIGADATYIFWSNDDIRIGAGGFFRFTQASASIEMMTSEQDTDVGGAQFGFGARIRF